MTRTAVIMAGGRGERMARSGVDVPKPLVRIAGVSLVEWNLRLLLRSGVDRRLVSVAAGDVEVRGGRHPLRAIGDQVGVAVDELVEEGPLGSIGAVRLLGVPVDPVLVVYADNLTGIDLRRLYDDHLAGDADLTLGAPRALRHAVRRADSRSRRPRAPRPLHEKPTYRLLVSAR
jgi:NDP-sugar pyrophosphorylase family protein